MLMVDLQQAIEVCIQQMATVFQDRKSQLVFFINNYDIISRNLWKIFMTKRIYTWVRIIKVLKPCPWLFLDREAHR